MRVRKSDKNKLTIDITGLTLEQDREEIQKRIDTKLGLADSVVRDQYLKNAKGEDDYWETIEFLLVFVNKESKDYFQQYIAASRDYSDTVFLMGDDSHPGWDYAGEDSYDIDSFNDMLFDLLAEKMQEE